MKKIICLLVAALIFIGCYSRVKYTYVIKVPNLHRYFTDAYTLKEGCVYFNRNNKQEDPMTVCGNFAVHKTTTYTEY